MTLTYFSGHKFWNVIISKMVSASEKCSSMTFIEIYNLPSNGTIVNLVLRDLDLNLHSQTFRVAILTSKRWRMQTLLLPSDRKSGICHRMAPLRILYILTFTNIFKVTNYEKGISRKQWELEKMLKNDFYRGWYLPSNGTIVNVELRDLDINFHGQTSSGYFHKTGKCKHYYCIR